MDLVDHDLEVHRVAGGRIGSLGCMTKDAHRHTDAGPSMKREAVMAPTAALISDDVTRHRNWAAIGDEVECRRGVVRSQVEAR